MNKLADLVLLTNFSEKRVQRQQQRKPRQVVDRGVARACGASTQKTHPELKCELFAYEKSLEKLRKKPTLNELFGLLKK